MSRTHFFCNKNFAKNTSRPTHDSMRNNLYDIVATHDPQSPDKDTLLKISQRGELASKQKTVVYMLIDVSGSMEHTLDKLTKRLAALIANLPNNVALVVITFSDKAKILCNFKSMNDVNRAQAQRDILWLNACGGTNIEDALNVATEVECRVECRVECTAPLRPFQNCTITRASRCTQ